MAEARVQQEYRRPLRRIFALTAIFLCLAVFLVWRIDSPRVERIRASVVDALVPRLDWALAPLDATVKMAQGFRSYVRLHEQNQELRRELQQMQAWKEAALQLEQQNARLLDLNNVRLDPRHTYFTGRVMADSGSPFRQSVLLNVGAEVGVEDGLAVMDGLGLVGRVSGTGRRTSRVLLLTDGASRIPVIVQPSGTSGIVQGDNGPAPLLDFIEDREAIRPGDRIVTSGDGGVFPPGLLVGQVALDPSAQLRARLAADYGRLEFLRVLRARPQEELTDPGTLIGPQLPEGAAPAVPEVPVAEVGAESGDG